MRTLISTLTGLSLLAAIFLSGGASLRSDQAVESAPSTPLPIAAPFSRLVEPEQVRDVLRAPTSDVAPRPTPANIDPAAGQPLNQWFGCQPPQRGSICILRQTGAEALIPDQPTSAEDWRRLVEVFFAPSDVDRALAVMTCESRGDPSAKNTSSSASGLFQHLASLWPSRAAAAGYGGVDVFDPVANVAVASWLVSEGGGWRHWNASRHCWR